MDKITNVKVAIWGFGAMGQGMIKMLTKKKGVDITAICSRRPERVKEVIKERQQDIIIESDIDKAVTPGSCDICIIATDSFVKKAYDKMAAILEKGINVITIAEEMAYPLAQEPELTKKLNEIAVRNNVSVLGTGINPGFVMDLLAICLSGCMTDVKSVTCKRVNSLSPFGISVMQEQGIGLTVEEFERKVKEKKLAGHVGFSESIHMISDAIGLGVDRVEQQMSAIVTDVDRQAPHGFAAAGNVAGVNMTGQGLRDGKVVVDMIHPQQIEPEMGGTQTGDYIVLEGNPRVDMRITPEINGGDGTIAMCVNCIPHVINAEPGLCTMIDIPVPRALMGDFRSYVKPEKKIVK